MARKRRTNAVGVLLRMPIFRRLWAAIAISSLGDWLGLLATSSLAYYLTRDSSNLAQGAAVSGVLLTRLLPDLILGPVAGALVDRFDRRKVAVIGDSLAGLLYLSIMIGGNLTWLFVAQFLVEAIGLFSTPAKQAMWVNIVPRERLAVANQLNYVSVYGMVPVAALLFASLSTVAEFFGASMMPVDPTSGLISGDTSDLAVDIALTLNALSFWLSAFIVFTSRALIPAFLGERSTSSNLFSLISEGVSFVRKNRLMRSIYVGILGAFGAGGLVAGVALPYVTSLGAGNAGYSLLFGSVFTGLALGMLVGPKVLPTVPRRMIFTPAIGGAGAALLVMAVLQDVFGAVLAAAVMGLFAGVAWITGFTMIGQEVTDQLRGRVFAFVMSSVRITLLGTIALGPVLAGAIGSHELQLGRFRMPLSGPSIVLALGGVIAIAVSYLAGRQIGGLARDVVRRIFGRRRIGIWHEDDQHAGVLIAVEGTDIPAVRAYASAVSEHLRSEGWLTVSERLDPSVHPAGTQTPANALRLTAELADLASERLRPALDAGAVVVCEGFVDATIVRYRVVDGLDERRLAMVALWAVNGLRADLTLLVDTVAGAVAPAPRGEPADDAVSVGDAGSAADTPPPRIEELPVTTKAPADPPSRPLDAPPGRSTAAPSEPALARVGTPGASARRGRDQGVVATIGAGTQGDHATLIAMQGAWSPRASGRPADRPTADGPTADGPTGDRPTGEDAHEEDAHEADATDAPQAFRDRASYTPERYLVVPPPPEHWAGALPAEVVERIESVLRLRAPVLAEPTAEPAS